MAIATLPMYDMPGLRPALEAWWSGLARAFKAEGIAGVPDRLTFAAHHHDPWRDPDLLVTQTCGYPLTHAFARDLRPVAAIRWAIPGLEGTEYHSAILVRANDPAQILADLRGRVCAFNSRDSHSGMNALRHAIAPLAGGRPFFARMIESGGHRASTASVRNGEADICAVDIATYALIERHHPDLIEGLRILARSATAPGLPYATRLEADGTLVRRLRAGFAAAAADPALGEARAALLIAGIEPVDRAAYDRIDAMENEARALGYPELA
jgi:ABC-type phosphate/phosphonate transport system substrate-binding protein